MSLIAVMAASVSAYAVSSSSFASGACGRAWVSISTPVIWGIRWSVTISATGWSRSASRASTSSASGPDVVRTIRYSAL